MILGAALALGLALGQHPAPAPEARPVPPTEQGAAPVESAASHGAAAAEHGGPAQGAPAHGEPAGEVAEGGHGGGHGEKLTLPVAIMHHVANGELLEFPGYCHGSLRWNCELDLRQATKELLGREPIFTIAGITFDMTPSKHVVMMWIAAFLLVVLLVGVTRRRSLVPRGLYNFFELLVQFVRDELAVKNIGKRDGERFVPYLAAAFFFILFMNLLGLVPWAGTATANLSVTVGLALFTFVVTQYAAIREQGVGGFLKHLTGGVPPSLAWLWPIMIPVEILGLFTKPFALTVRLFANMVAGHFVILGLLGLIFTISAAVAPLSILMAVGIFLLEIFVAFVQAYIFTMLSALFIGMGFVHHGEHGDDHAADEGSAANQHGAN